MRHHVHEVRDIPQPEGAIGADNGQDFAVGAERHREDPAGGTGEGAAYWVARGQVPQADGAIATAGSQGGAVRAERHRGDRAGGAGERGDLPVGGHVPQPDNAAIVAGGQRLAIRAERDRGGWACVAGEGGVDRAGRGQAPERDNAVGTATG